MNYSKCVESYKVPEWASEYIDYRNLKKSLYELQQTLKGNFLCVKEECGMSESEDSSSEVEVLSHVINMKKSLDVSIIEKWSSLYLVSISKADKFYLLKLKEVARKLEELKGTIANSIVL